jgi:hypothetical protein
MTRLFAALRPATLLAAIPLTTCSTPPPPYAPTALAIPRSGESASQYQADSLACRQYMAAANRSAGGNNSSNAGIIAGAQSPYDVAYAQCMTRKGYMVETSNWLNAVVTPPRYGSASSGGYPSAYAYPSDYPSAYAHPGGYPYYVTSPYAVGTLPFFFFVTHGHNRFHHEGDGHFGH